jgi:protein-tyrosine phosphatase
MLSCASVLWTETFKAWWTATRPAPTPTTSAKGPIPARPSTASAAATIFSFHHARKVRGTDFHEFDWILAMDQSHLEILQELSVPDLRARVALFLSAIPGCDLKDTPDPYYGGDMGFEQVLDLCEQGCDAWLDKVLSER